jgi:hypothetical protein
MLARAGRSGITVNDSPACIADLHILESRALAVLGDSRGASTAVAKAEDTFQHVVPENERPNGPDSSTCPTSLGKRRNRSETSNNLIRSSVSRGNLQSWQNSKAVRAAVR